MIEDPSPKTEQDLYYALHTLLRNYLRLPMWLIQPLGGEQLRWRELNQRILIRRPTVYEQRFRRKDAWLKHILRHLRAATAKGGVQLGQCYGFHCLVAPLPGPDKSCIYAADFYTRFPDWALVSEQWRQISGRKSDGSDPDAIAFTKLCLGLPVLGRPLLADAKRALELYARWLSGRLPSDEGCLELSRLHGAFAKHRQHEDWVRQLAGEPQWQPRPPRPDLEAWESFETGLRRLPNVALVVLPRERSFRGLNACQRLLRMAWMQYQGQFLARRLTDSVALPQGQEGLVFFSAVADRASVRELLKGAEALRGLCQERLNMDVSVGIGPVEKRGQTLELSREAALNAALAALASGAPALTAGSLPRLEKGPLDLALLRRQLIEAVRLRQVQAVQGLRSAYVDLAVECHGHSLEGLRAVLQQCVADLIHSSQPDSSGALMGGNLHSAASIDEVLEAFRERLDAVLRGPRALVEGAQVRRALVQAPPEWKVPRVAQELGLSESSLRRALKRQGSGSPAAAVRAARLDQARHLLLESHLSIEAIAIEAGFNSARHFRRAFQQQFRQSPRAARQSH